MKLSIVIVNYNVKYFLEQCLLSVARAIVNVSAEVLVVDNASSDGSCAYVREKFPWVKLIESPVNLGFSKGNNLAIQAAGGEYILLLNPDTVVAEDTFEKCISFMDAHVDAGALGVHMIDGKGNFLPESKRGLPTPSVAFYKTFGLAAVFPKSKIFGRYHLGFLDEHETNEVEVLSGAYMFMRKEALDKTGLLDETFFMYGEDIDLSYRIIKAGYKNYYFAGTTIIHYKGESTKKGSVNYVKVFYNAMIIFARKHFSGNQSGFFSAFINLAIFFRGFLTVLANVFSSSYLFIIDALLSFGGIFLLKTYWEDMIKYPHNYYPDGFLFIVVPVYIVIWIVATFIAGGYDKPFRISNIFRGIFFGTLAIAAIYGFLPNDWRFSRAMILLGAIWTALEMVLTRTTYHLIKYQTLSIENDDEKKALLVGKTDECQRAAKLLQDAGAESEVIAFVQDESELVKLAGVYSINEVIFCSRDITYKQIIDNILACGSNIDYKILNPGSEAFIGSNSKNTAGDLYSVNHNLNLAKPVNQRKKRLFDVALCIALIPLFPFNLFMIPNFGRFLTNWFEVLSEGKTWVGYADNGTEKLPAIRQGVITVAADFSQMDIDTSTLSNINLLYAKYYSVGRDLKLIWNNYRKLGR
ncbi:MAG: glycosyl transferase family 2 [Bacteroidota bacterium]|nr:glycosyl transferase family 2 [Bacteroidota bacterium]